VIDMGKLAIGETQVKKVMISDLPIKKIMQGVNQIWTAFAANIYYIIMHSNYGYKMNEEGQQLWQYPAYTGNQNTVIEVDKDGNVYIFRGDNKFHKINKDGGFIWEYMHPYTGNFTGACIDKDSNVYTSLYVNGLQMVKLSKDGNEIYRHNYGTNRSTGIAIDQNDSSYILLYDSTYGKRYIRKIPQNGSYRIWETEISLNTCIATDKTGTYLYAPSINSAYSIAKYKTQDGSEVWNYEPSPSHMIRSVAVDKDDYIYCGRGNGEAIDTNEGGITKLSPTGSLIWDYTDIYTVRNIAVDKEGFIYAGHGAPNVGGITKFNPSGQVVTEYDVGSVIKVAVDPGKIGDNPSAFLD